MGLLDELLKDAERFTASGTANIDHVVATVNRVLNARFADVLRGRRIQVRPVLDRHQHIWRLEAELQIAIPFSLAVTEEVLDQGTVPELTQLASREAEKLSRHIVTELTRQLGGPVPSPRPLPKPPSPVRDFDVMAPDLQRPLLTFREWMTASSNQRVYVSDQRLRELYDHYTYDWHSQNDGAAKDEVLDAITTANRLAELDEAPIPDMPFGKKEDAS